MIKWFFITISFILLLGCGDSTFWDSSCESEMNKVRDKLGSPEEVKTYKSGSYTNTDWWYWTKGIEYSFTYYSSCDVSTYTFSPIK